MGLFETSVESCLSRDSLKLAALSSSRMDPRPVRLPLLSTSSTKTECSSTDPAPVLAGKYRIKNLHLTPLKITFPFSARTKVVRKAWEDEKVSEKWAESGWAKRMQMKARRQGLNDFDRFKLMKAKSARNKILAKAVAIKKNKMSKAGKL